MLLSWRGPAVILLCVCGLYVGVRPWLLTAFGPAVVVAAVLAAVAGVGVAVAFWHSLRYRYLCPVCGCTFAASTVRNLAGQNWFGRLRTRCPACGQTHWCEPVRAAAPTADSGPPAPAPPPAGAPRSAPGPS